jgi:serine/threonine protein kinase
VISVQMRDGVTLADRYRLEQRLDCGGMGTVWRARDVRLGRTVAVKLAERAGGAHAGAGRRLRREAAMVGALAQPRVARVFDYFETGEHAVLVMELVQGESLAALLRRERRLPAQRAARIAAQLAEALWAIHRVAIVHRDVKPSNVMLTGAGVKLVDFGIAVETQGEGLDEQTRTAAHLVVGTAAYLAPERVHGGRGGPEADLYALGVVLYQMLAGRLPFPAGDTLGTLYAHANAEPAELPDEVPDSLRGLCRQLLAKDPGERPGAEQVVRTLNGRGTVTGDLLATETSGAYVLRSEPIPPPQDGGRVRGPLVAALLTGCALAVGVGVTLVPHSAADSGAGPAATTSTTTHTPAASAGGASSPAAKASTAPVARVVPAKTAAPAQQPAAGKTKPPKPKHK